MKIKIMLDDDLVANAFKVFYLLHTNFTLAFEADKPMIPRLPAIHGIQDLSCPPQTDCQGFTIAETTASSVTL
ncbi:MAG: hypothetical protein WBB70_11185 [Desulfobacterales bacterium]